MTALAMAVLLSLLCVIPCRADDGGVAVQILPSKHECFYEEVGAADIKVFLHYMVTSGGAMDIDVEIFSPQETIVWRSEKDSENRVLFKSRSPGSYRFCFSNEMSTLSTKVVAFSVMVGDLANQRPGDGNGPSAPMDSLQRSILSIHQGLREIEEIQGYLRTRERSHRATTEVANTRIVVWSLLEIVAIVGMGFANVYYLRRMFNTKRAV